MKVFDCFKIKTLKERLVCLEKRYKDIVNDIERERESIISDESGNLPLLLAEKEFVIRQIEKNKSRIKSSQKFKHTLNMNLNKIEIGNHVKLTNHTHDLEIYLVDSNEAEPAKGLVSAVSPIGKAVMGKFLGETVLVSIPKGKISYKIAKIY